jgi:dipeptidyl-peptidase-3
LSTALINGFFFADEELTFIHPDDVDLYNAWDSRAFELQVANHELLGHGSGKLFQEDTEGKKNFDPEKVRSCKPTDFRAN